MAHFTNDSAIKLNSSLEEQISRAASTTEIQALLHQAALDQHLVQPDPFDSEGKNYFGFRPVEPGSVAAAKGFAKTLVVDGQKIILESPTEAGLVQEELKVMRALFDKPADTMQEEQPRNERGWFITHDPSAVALAPSVTAALEAAGVSVDELKAYTQTKRDEAYQQSWVDAGAAFQANHSDWIGGTDNMNLFVRLITENNLTDAPDKAAALEAVYQHAVEHNLLVENEEIALANRVNAATTPDELRAAVGYKDPSSSGGFWGR